MATLFVASALLLLVFGVGVHDSLVLCPLLHVYIHFSMFLCSIDGVDILQFFCRVSDREKSHQSLFAVIVSVLAH